MRNVFLRWRKRWQESFLEWLGRETGHNRVLKLVEYQISCLIGVPWLLMGIGRPNGEKASPLDPENARLPAGRYLLKACLDSKSRLADDLIAMLGQEDYLGQTGIQAQWRD